MTAYSSAAHGYVTADWSPIPVKSKYPPAPGVTGYPGAMVTAETVDQ